MSQIEQITKQVAEKYLVEIDYKPYLPIGAKEVIGSELTAVRWLNTSPETKTATSEILLSGNGTIVAPNNTRIEFWVASGTDNYTYQISVLTTFDNTSVLKDEIFVRVLNS